MENPINRHLLYECVTSKGQLKFNNYINGRTLSLITGISKSTAYSILDVEDKVYSLESMFKLCVWLEKPLDFFLKEEVKEVCRSIQKTSTLKIK